MSHPFPAQVYNALITALVDLKNLSELLAQKPLVVDPDPAVDHPGGDGLFERGLAVAFHDVAFCVEIKIFKIRSTSSYLSGHSNKTYPNFEISTRGEQ